ASHLTREGAAKLAPESAARDLAVTGPPHETRESADVLETRAWRTRVERYRRPESAAARDEIQKERHAGEHEGAARPGPRHQHEHVGRRVDAVVVLVEGDDAAGGDSLRRERESETPVIRFAELRGQERRDGADHDERPRALAGEGHDRTAGRRDERHAPRAERKGDAAIERDRVGRRIGECDAADRILARTERTGD